MDYIISALLVIGIAAFVIVPFGFGDRSGTRFAIDDPPVTAKSWWKEARESISLVNPVRIVDDWWLGHTNFVDALFRLFGLAVFGGVAFSIFMIGYAVFHMR